MYIHNERLNRTFWSLLFKNTTAKAGYFFTKNQGSVHQEWGSYCLMLLLIAL